MQIVCGISPCFSCRKSEDEKERSIFAPAQTQGSFFVISYNFFTVYSTTPLKVSSVCRVQLSAISCSCK